MTVVITSYDDVMEEQEQPWVIEGQFRRQELIMLYAPSGSMKTFVALDIACRIAARIPVWWGGKSMGGDLAPALYVLGERCNLRRRIQAWAQANVTQDEQEKDLRARLKFVRKQRIDLLCPRWRQAFLDSVKACYPSGLSLVIFDTLNVCAGDFDENSANDAARLGDALCEVAEATGAAVLFLHHTRKDEEKYRGSSAILGFLEASVRLRREGDLVEVHQEKARDEENAPTLYLRPNRVEVGTDSHSGEVAYSIRLSEPDAREVQQSDALSKPSLLHVLRAIQTAGGPDGGARACDFVGILEDGEVMKARTAHNWRRDAQARGLVFKGEDGLWRLTPEGELLLASSDKGGNDEPSE